MLLCLNNVLQMVVPLFNIFFHQTGMFPEKPGGLFETTLHVRVAAGIRSYSYHLQVCGEVLCSHIFGLCSF